MKLWEKAKEKYPALSRMDFIALTCPDKLGILEKPADCKMPDVVKDTCVKCWDREIGEDN